VQCCVFYTTLDLSYLDYISALSCYPPFLDWIFYNHNIQFLPDTALWSELLPCWKPWRIVGQSSSSRWIAALLTSSWSSYIKCTLTEERRSVRLPLPKAQVSNRFFIVLGSF
jgi:hypothetical protein